MTSQGPPPPTPAAAAARGEAFADLRRDPVVRALVAACRATECHLVGGALRDRALGLATQDLDAVVAGRGREIAAELSETLPARLVLLGGKEFAAYRLLLAGGTLLDLWDRESFSLLDDLARRDFTVNSFALEPQTGVIVDPFGGFADLARRTLRATTRGAFLGDPLRVLRLARLQLRLPGFTADPDTAELARRAAPRLAEVASERVRDELWLVFSHPAAERGLRALAALDLYPGLWLGTPGAPEDERAAPRVERAAAELAALPACATELELFLAAAAASRASDTAPASAGHGPASDWDPIDFRMARFAATFRYLSAAARGASATGPGAPRAAEDRHAAGASTAAASQGAAAGLYRMRQAGYLSARQEAEIEPLLAEPAELPQTEISRRQFLHHHGRGWLTAACSFGAAAAAASRDALDRWRAAAAPLCEVAQGDGASLIAPPRLLNGDDVRRLLGIPAGPQVGLALAALTAAQVDGVVRTRDDAERFLHDRRAHAWR